MANDLFSVGEGLLLRPHMSRLFLLLNDFGAREALSAASLRQLRKRNAWQ